MKPFRIEKFVHSTTRISLQKMLFSHPVLIEVQQLFGATWINPDRRCGSDVISGEIVVSTPGQRKQ
jgi:hypothetical protein